MQELQPINFRDKAAKLLNDKLTQLIVLSVFVAITLYLNAIAHFFGLTYVLLSLWANRWSWQRFGLLAPVSWSGVILQAIIFAVLLFVLGNLIVTPLIIKITGVGIDYSIVDSIRGNLEYYLLLLLYMWVFAAFGEEFVYRGFLIMRISLVFGDTRTARWLTIIMSAVLFGLAHRYQGISGMIGVGLYGFFFGVLFITNKNRLWLTILTHGIYDMLMLTLIYFRLDLRIYEFFGLEFMLSSS